MEISLGLGESLVYLSSRRPADVLARVRIDASLRTRVSKILDECFKRAKNLIAEHSESFDGVARVLMECDAIGASEVERLVSEKFSLLSETSSNGSVTVGESFNP
ncbi:MAG: hypothetical protein BGO65_09445 [Afipia sp. 64-13]|nr:MAG: hypothetical protein BGO65_09445 [Afipia sp. 64-13]